MEACSAARQHDRDSIMTMAWEHEAETRNEAGHMTEVRLHECSTDVCLREGRIGEVRR